MSTSPTGTDPSAQSNSASSEEPANLQPASPASDGTSALSESQPSSVDQASELIEASEGSDQAQSALAHSSSGEAESHSKDAGEIPSAAPAPYRRLRRRQIIMGLAVLLTGGLAAGLPFYNLTAPITDEDLAPSDEERFKQFYQALKQSNETVVRFDAVPINDARLRSLTEIERLTSLHIRVEKMSVETAALIGAMPHLEELHLRGTQIDDAMLRGIARSQTLRVLNLPSCVISSEALESLRAIPTLNSLRLGIKQGTNQHARTLATVTRLRAVHLIGVAVTDEGLQSLAEMPALESLYLDDSAVTEAGWLWLFDTYPELHVHIDQLHHDRDPQRH